MCGIAAFLGARGPDEPAVPAWLDGVAGLAGHGREGTAERVRGVLDRLQAHFDDLMAFGLHYQAGVHAGVRAELEALAGFLERFSTQVERTEAAGDHDALDVLAERARDYAWQLRWEVLGNLERTAALIPLETPNTAQHYVAWAVEQTLQAIDRLEIRGRDSAGLRLVCVLPRDVQPVLDSAGVDAGGRPADARSVRCIRPGAGDVLFCFTYKVSNAVGRLGDNTRDLRRLIREDDLLWRVARSTRAVNVIAHTRWASNGIISVPNCHPVDAMLRNDASANDAPPLAFAVNGDVDNYAEQRRHMEADGVEIDPSVTTDAKMPALLYRLRTPESQAPEDRFGAVMNACEGSLAVIMQDCAHPDTLLVGQKGSGQSLFFASTRDGWIVASEVHGLAARARSCYALSGLVHGGTQCTIRSPAGSRPRFRYLDGSALDEGSPIAIDIYSRDTYIGDHDFYLDKELHEAPQSIRKTLRGKVIKAGTAVEFVERGPDSFGPLIRRLRDRSAPSIDRVLIIGQGTAAIAAMGVAHFISRLSGRVLRQVVAAKASEVSGFLDSNEGLESTLVIAISQSGTTTDTNRTVDLVSAEGAWVHAIVNRRGSPLVTRADSHTYTSDGRDVEMSVASTKAFYSQVAAGKLLALVLARELGACGDAHVRRELSELEQLADKVQAVLNRSEHIGALARAVAAGSTNWAVVGNGPNMIAAQEIRIKLSELCYKSIPCDVTEDKKHIDLSTEPLTLVVANDLPESIVQDTAKEIAIFKAHGGRPIVLCTLGEDRFNPYAEHVVELPPIGAGLGFVLATVAGHLWGYHAARAIDGAAGELRHLRQTLTACLGGARHDAAIREHVRHIVEALSQGSGNAALAPHTVAKLGLYLADITSAAQVMDQHLHRGIALLTEAIEAMTRPIDSIRHQAKTVTVGISRPQAALAASVARIFDALSISPDQLKPRDLREMTAVSPLIEDVEGALLYRVIRGPGGVLLKADERAFGCSRDRPSRYRTGLSPAGTKRKALRIQRLVWGTGPTGNESFVLVPAFSDGRECDRLVLLHVCFVREAPLPTKLHVLRALGSRYDDLIELVEEVTGSAAVEEVVNGASPRDLVLGDLRDLHGLA